MESESVKRKRGDENEELEEDPGSELDLPFWSVVSFDRCLRSNLTYAEAVEELAKHLGQEANGLCIVTDKAAERLGRVEG